MRSSAISLQMRYDSEALYFDEWVRTSKRKQLEEKLLQLVLPAFQLVLGHLRSGTLEKFKEAFGKALSGGEGSSSAARDCIKLYMAQFDEGCEDAVIEQAKWDTSRVREKLKRDIDVHIAAVRETKLSELTKAYEMKLNDALSGSVEALLDEANDKTWPAIRKLLQCETDFAISGFSNAVTGFELDEQTNEKMITHLRDYARGMVESKIKQEAGKVLSRMKDRFETLFSRDADSMPRVWTGKEDIRGITKTERSASLKLLSAMAAIRLDNEADNIERSLSLALLDPKSNSTVTDWSITSAADPLAASTWEEVPSTKTVITPVQCKNLWRQFKSETEYSVAQAMAAQEAARRTNNLLPPPWAIVAMVILGFNEFMKLLRNPLYLGVIFVGYLIIKAVWVQLDVSGEFRHGALPGIISLTHKFLPTIMNLLKKLAEAGQAPQTKDHHKNPALGSKSFGSRVGTSTSMSSTGSSVVIQDETTEYSSTSKED